MRRVLLSLFACPQLPRNIAGAWAVGHPVQDFGAGEVEGSSCDLLDFVIPVGSFELLLGHGACNGVFSGASTCNGPRCWQAMQHFVLIGNLQQRMRGLLIGSAQDNSAVLRILALSATWLHQAFCNRSVILVFALVARNSRLQRGITRSGACGLAVPRPFTIWTRIATVWSEALRQCLQKLHRSFQSCVHDYATVLPTVDLLLMLCTGALRRHTISL